MHSLKEFKETFDPVLNDFIDKKIDEFLKKTNDPFIKDFISYSKNLIKGGGKRIRPYMAYLGYKSFGGKNEKEIMNILLSLELFHNFCLIHDDVMDRGETRHGQKTIHEFVLEKLKKEKRTGDLNLTSISQAILIGDIIYAWLTDLFFENQSLKNLDLAKKYFYKMADEVIMGQIIDVDLVGRNNPSLDLIEEKTRLKTSRYTFVRPLQIGAILGNANHNQDDFLETLGTNLGMGFQMKDDLLDIIGNQDKIQKTPLLDIAQHQHTFFTNYVQQHADQNQKKIFDDVFGGRIEGNENKIRSLFADVGATDAGEKIIYQYFETSKKLITASDLDSEYKEIFMNLILLLQQRKN